MKNQILGERYKIINKLGEGGMAAVYAAMDLRLNRKVAIKVLHPHLANNPDIKQRFYLEAKIISTLEHPNILKIYDFSGEESDYLWIVTELLNGENLNKFSQKFKDKIIHPIIATCIVREILKALQEAHNLNLVHRDIKPENVMILKTGHIKLMDFGIAKTYSEISLTMTGTFMGSPSYMSPEQIRGKNVDARSDIYSLGVLFYEILTGRLPYIGNSTHDVVLKICEGKCYPPQKYVPSIPDDLNAIVMKAINIDPDKRYQKVQTFASDLDIFLALNGFEESNIELERYFANKEIFEERLKLLNFTSTDNSQPLSQYYNVHAVNNNIPKPNIVTEIANNNTITSGKFNTLKINIINTPLVEAKNPNNKEENLADHSSRPIVNQDKTKKVEFKKISLSNNELLQRKPHISKGAFIAKHQASFKPINKMSVNKVSKSLYLKMATLKRSYSPWFHIVSFIFVGIFLGLLIIVSFKIYKYVSYSEVNKTIIPTKREPLNKLIDKIEPSINKIDKKIQEIQKATNQINIKNFIENSNSKDQNQNKISYSEPKNSKPSDLLKTSNLKTSTTTIKSSLNKQEPSIGKNNKQSIKRIPQIFTNKESYSQYTKNYSLDNNNTKISSYIEQKSVSPDTANIQQYNKALDNQNTLSQPSKHVLNITADKYLPMSFSEIIIQSQPAAEIYIDGKKVGTTIDYTTSSGIIRLKPGKYVLELKRPGYETYLMMLNLNAGEIRRLTNIKLKGIKK